jgi:hypothetical protein
MKLEMTLGNPILIFIYGLALLLFGCAIGIHWHATPAVAVGLALLGAALMVLHEMFTAILWFWITAACVRRVQNRIRPSSGHDIRDDS